MTSKKKQSRFQRRYAAMVLLLFLALGIYGFTRLSQDASSLPAKPLSRAVLELAVTQIKANKPPPTQAALQDIQLAPLQSSSQRARPPESVATSQYRPTLVRTAYHQAHWGLYLHGNRH